MDLGLEKITKLPNKQKAALLIVLLLAVGAILFFLVIKPKYAQLKDLETTLTNLKTQIEENRRIAANLPALIIEYERMKRALDGALTELPNQKEIPALLTSITNEGKGAGLDFLVFRPKAEVPRDFYAEVPVDITISGTYANVGNFFSAVARLQRIVNISNVVFSEIRTTDEKTMLKVTCVATTFRFLDKKEQKDEKKAQ